MAGNSYQSIISLENLLHTWERFLRGKRKKLDVMQFQLSLAENLAALHQDLRQKTYTHQGYLAFNVSDPKPRNIHKASVRDRVVHHLLYKELYPYFHERFIHDSYSCQVGKGVHRALDRFEQFARRVSKNNRRTCYVLKGDIRKFFASIDHEVLTAILERHVADPDIRWLLGRIIVSFDSGRTGVGLPLGNLTSQLLVNVYMHEFDRFVKQEVRVKYYIRYADDFVILSEDRAYLEDILPSLQAFLKGQLKLELHPNKVSLETYASGVDFLGWVHFPYHRQLRTATKRKILKNLEHFPKPETVQSYRGLMMHGSTYRIRKKAGLAS